MTPLYEQTIAATGVVPDGALTYQPDGELPAAATGPLLGWPATQLVTADQLTAIRTRLDDLPRAGRGQVWDPEAEAEAVHQRAAVIYPNLARNAPRTVHVGLVCALLIVTVARIFAARRWR